MSPEPAPRPVMTVQGPVAFTDLGITDAHNHVWIEAVAGADPAAPRLDQFDLMVKELIDYRGKGGASILDCQPGGCGRDGNRLLALSRASGVHLIGCTGFHLKKYYAPDFWLWEADAQKIGDYFTSELEQGLLETMEAIPVRAGFIKIALQAAWKDCPQAALEGAAAAAHASGALVEIHTEKGALAEKACVYFMGHGLRPEQLVLCHMDKRPDFGIQRALAELGVLLEYDTFYRPKYEPDLYLWPLIDQMAASGLADRVALATDMAEPALYHTLGTGPGLGSLPGEIRQRLTTRMIPEAAISQMLGGNIARRLAGIP